MFTLFKCLQVIECCQLLRIMALDDSSEEIRYNLPVGFTKINGCDRNFTPREVLQFPLQSICKTFPSLAKEHLISPLLLELDVNPVSAGLLAVMAVTPPLAASILSSLLSVVEQLVQTTSPIFHKDRYWEIIFSISLALLKLLEHNAESVPLNPDSLLQLSQQAANIHWQCCIAEVSKLIELLSTALSLTARHASVWLVYCLCSTGSILTACCIYSWCDSGMKVIVNTVMAEPSCILTSAPPNGLCLVLLTALLSASPPAV